MNIKELIQWIQGNTGLSVEVQKDILGIAFSFIVLYAVRLLILKIAFRYKKGAREQYKWRKTTLYIGAFIFIAVVGALLIEAFTQLVTFLSIVAGAIVLALKDPIIGIAGWAFIIWRRPFDVGDRIQIGQQKGDVIDQRLFMFSLMEVGNWVDAEQSTGRVIHIPNGIIFHETLANYSKGFEYIWDEISVLITFESDWRKAKKILSKIADKHSENLTQSAETKLKRAAKKYMIFLTKKLTSIVYTSVKESGVCLTIRHLCEPKERRTMSSEIWEDVLVAFEKEKDISFAYPTTRFYDNTQEEKGEA